MRAYGASPREVRNCSQTKNQSGNEDCSRAFHAIVSISMAASQPLQLRQDILALTNQEYLQGFLLDGQISVQRYNRCSCHRPA
jgi:hypothetical protein